jgi:hypothetical protein
MTTIPTQLLGMVVQSLQKTRAGLAKDFRRTQPVYPPGQLLESRARSLLQLAEPGKITLCQKIGIHLPHPTPTTLSSIGGQEKTGEKEEGGANTSIKVLPHFEDRGKLCTIFKFVHPSSKITRVRLQNFEKK